MTNHPERSIESSTDHSSLRYYFSLYISHQGTWLMHLLCKQLSLHIIESNPGFASVTNISPVRATVINIGHLDEIHYVPTQFPSTNQPLKSTTTKLP